MSGIAGQTVYRAPLRSTGSPAHTHTFSQTPAGLGAHYELGRFLDEERIVALLALLELLAASRGLQIAMDAYNDADGESFEAENACALALANHQAALERVEAVA